MKEDMHETSDELVEKLTEPLVDIIEFFNPKDRRALFLLYCVNLFKPAFTSELSSILGYNNKKVWYLIKKLKERGVIEKINLNPQNWVKFEHDGITLYLPKEYFHRHTSKIEGKLPDAFMWRGFMKINRERLIRSIAEDSQHLLSRIENLLMDFVNQLSKSKRGELLEDAIFVISRMQKLVSVLQTEGMIRFTIQENHRSVVVSTGKGNYLIPIPTQVSSFIK